MNDVMPDPDYNWIHWNLSVYKTVVSETHHISYINFDSLFIVVELSHYFWTNFGWEGIPILSILLFSNEILKTNNKKLTI